MPRYVVNDHQQSNGDHEVHKEGCIYWPSSYTELGSHDTCTTAVAAAKRHYRQSDGCATCSPACHKS
jgi:hypothetical protein